ncbi:MAG: chromosomal replication initiator protein DnaA [Candidatus Doudnabacteria bacterium]|nr:chromosomal replication initiator protein DnaA [Candidatus Doudnabacteria bacterium]
MTNQQLWQAILGNMELSLSKANFTTWFKNTSIIEKSDTGIVVGVPNAFSKEWLQNKYHQEIIKALKTIAPEIKEVKYQIVSPTFVAPIAPREVSRGSVSAQRKPEANQNLNPKYTFESFIVGSHNQLAHAASQAVSKKPGSTYNPLFIYGGVGLGKTHLMQAVGNEVLKRTPEAKILYVTSERFTNDFVSALSQGKADQFKSLYRNMDVLLVDDIQFLAGKEGTQEEFFHTFNALHQNNRQVVMTSDRLPKEIPAIEERLVSRFEWGMIADIAAPDLETRLAILKTKCKEKNYNIEPEILQYIAETIQSNIRELEGALNRLMVYCQLNNTRPTIDQVKNILVSVITPPKKRGVSAKKIIEVVSDFYNVSPEDLLKQSRKKEYVNPRQIAMYIIRKELETSLPSIGEFFGGRDHTTVIHAIDKIERIMKEKNSLKQEIDLIKDRIYLN